MSSEAVQVESKRPLTPEEIEAARKEARAMDISGTANWYDLMAVSPFFDEELNKCGVLPFNPVYNFIRPYDTMTMMMLGNRIKQLAEKSKPVKMDGHAKKKMSLEEARKARLKKLEAKDDAKPAE